MTAKVSINKKALRKTKGIIASEINEIEDLMVQIQSIMIKLKVTNENLDRALETIDQETKDEDIYT